VPPKHRFDPCVAEVVRSRSNLEDSITIKSNFLAKIPPKKSKVMNG